MSTPLLVLLSLVLPAAWGWLADALLRRVWPRQEPSPTSQPDDQSPVIDFQI